VGKVKVERALCDLGTSVSIMPYSLFHMLHLKPLLATPFSLQLADGSEMQPIDKLDDVLVNIGDIWVLEDFIIVDTPKIDDAQIILDRPILATAGCHIIVRKGWIAFEVEGCYVVFCHRKEDVVFPSSSLLDALVLSLEIDIEDVFNCDDPPDSDWISYKDPDQRYVKVEFPAPMPPNMPKVEVYISNEYFMSNYYRFTQDVLSMPPMEGFDADCDLGVEQVNSDMLDRARVCFVLYTDNALWHRVMKTKDLQPQLLRWYLRLKKFSFVVWNKVNVHTLSDPDQA